MIERYHFQTIDSTNSLAKRNLLFFKKEVLTAISAEEQTAGYGRQKRSWHSKKGENLLVTFLFHSSKELDQAHLVQLLAKIVQKVLKNYSVEATIKWPNDLLVNGKKIAGILVEIHDHWVIMGLGLNVNMDEDSLAQINQAATSLYLETGEKNSPDTILDAIAQELDGVAR